MLIISLACTLSSRPTIDAEPSALAQESGVRGELAETQSREGLTIADYGSHGLRIVDFRSGRRFEECLFPILAQLEAP